MKKIGYITIILLIFLLALALIPNSPIYDPLINHIQHRVEKNWECKVVIKKSAVNILRGTLTLNDLQVQTSDNANPNWNLNVNTSVIKIDYNSLVQRQWILSSLLLNNIRFKQLERDTSQDIAKKKDTNTKPTESDDKTSDDEKKGNETKKRVNIKRLIIQNGYFEYSFLHKSEMKDIFKVENVNLNRKNLFFDGKPSLFFKSILNPNKYLTTSIVAHLNL